MASLREQARRLATPSAEQASAPGGGSFLKGISKEAKGVVEAKEYYINVIPFNNKATGEQAYMFNYKVHWGVGVANRAYVCPTTIGLPCPICEQYEIQRKGKTKEEWNLIKHLQASERTLYNITDEDVDPNKIIVWDLAKKNFHTPLHSKLHLMASARYSPQDNYHFSEIPGGLIIGATFVAKAWGSAKPNIEAIDIQFHTRQQELDPALIDKAFDFSQLLNIGTYEELEAAYYGNEVPEHEPVSEVPAAPVRAAAPVTPTRRAPVATQPVVPPAAPAPAIPAQRTTPATTAPRSLGAIPPPAGAVRTQVPPARTAPAAPAPVAAPAARRTPAPAPVAPPAPVVEAPVSDNQCPAGLNFGSDCDRESPCASCEVFDACAEYRDVLNGK